MNLRNEPGNQNCSGRQNISSGWPGKNWPVTMKLHERFPVRKYRLGTNPGGCATIPGSNRRIVLVDPQKYFAITDAPCITVYFTTRLPICYSRTRPKSKHFANGWIGWVGKSPVNPKILRSKNSSSFSEKSNCTFFFTAAKYTIKTLLQGYRGFVIDGSCDPLHPLHLCKSSPKFLRLIDPFATRFRFVFYHAMRHSLTGR